MKTVDKKSAPRAGYALVVTFVFAAVSLITLGGILNWTSTTALNTDRNNQYFDTAAAAEAATEKVLAHMAGDFQLNGHAGVTANLSSYRNLRPLPSEDSYWNNFIFNNGAGTSDSTHVEQLSVWGYTNLNSQYAGLNGYATSYRIISNARSTVPPILTAALRQEFQLATIPVFQFAIFYTMDLEINPGAAMTVNGRVHSNGEIYTRPNVSVSYLDHVTAVRNINLFQSPLDPTVRPTNGVINFGGHHDADVAALTLPIGTNNSPAAVHSVVEQPPWGESANSLMGKQRYYNKADMTVVFDDSGVTALKKDGTGIAQSDLNTFLTTNIANRFYDQRQGKTNQTIQIDIALFNAFSSGAYKTLYVADNRTMPPGSQSGIRLVNGETLQDGGLTVATPNPVYVKGHYNSPVGTRGTSSTVGARPASLVADSITILSPDWNDANSKLAIGSRTAKNTTVNAAFLGGIVPSNGTYYSGGVENFPRFLENWSGKTFTYNGSMVVMFYSLLSTAPWPGTGSVYNAPNRNWSFDINFLDANKLPPGTPQLQAVIRGNWSLISPNTIL